METPLRRLAKVEATLARRNDGHAFVEYNFLGDIDDVAETMTELIIQFNQWEEDHDESPDTTT